MDVKNIAMEECNFTILVDNWVSMLYYKMSFYVL